METHEVHAGARDVIAFWFGLTKEQHFAKDDDLDRTIAERFGALHDRMMAARAEGWDERPDMLLAAIIVIDQFSRNLHRGTAAAFAGDALAQALTIRAIDRGWDEGYRAEERVFLYMPLMHAEDVPLQRLSVARFDALGIADNIAFARDHAAVIDRFGRFPSRNAALGRASTAAETDYLSQPGAGW